MEPLLIEARLRGTAPLALSRGYLHLDALLAYHVWVRMGMPISDEILDIEIPVQKSACGRFHLASAAVARWEQMETRWTQRRYPLQEATMFGDLTRVNLSAGPQKNWRLPLEAGHVHDDRLVWYAIADRAAVENLLAGIHYLGKKRSAGYGRVQHWRTLGLEEKWEGFPVVGPDGEALRHLPIDHPGLVDPVPAYGRLTFPYWRREGEVELAVPM